MESSDGGGGGGGELNSVYYLFFFLSFFNFSIPYNFRTHTGRPLFISPAPRQLGRCY